MANLDKSNADDIFLEAIGPITKVLCSLLLRTCSKDTGASQSGQTTVGGETGPTPASQGGGDTIKKSFVIQWIRQVAIQESDMSNRLTGRTHCVSKKLLFTLCDVGHPCEMVFVEPSQVFFDEMIGNQDDCLAFELWRFPGVSKVAISVGTLLSLTSEISAKLFGRILWENVRWVGRRVTEVKHTQILSLFGGSVNLYSMMRLFLPLTAGRIVFVCIEWCGIALASITLFGQESGIGSGTRCTICKGIIIILPQSASLSIIPRINIVSGNRTRHDCNSSHGSLVQVDLRAKCL